MMRTLKRILLRLAIGANVMAALLLLVCGLSERVNPAEHAHLALFSLGYPILLFLNVAFVLFWLLFSARHVWIPLLGMLCSISYIYEYCPLNWPKSLPSDALMLITYNLKSYNLGKTDEKGFNPILNYLAESNADIICLQEATTPGKMKQETTDSTMLAAGYQTLKLDDGQPEPQLVYSKLPILSAQRVPYGTTSNGSVAIELLYEGDTILLVNNHLESYKLTPEDRHKYEDLIKVHDKDVAENNSKELMDKMSDANRLRGPQADSVMKYVENAGREAVIVCGDFNDPPISYSCYRLSSHLESAFRQSGNGLGLSYNQKGFYVRIDHVFVSSYWQTYRTHVDKTAVWSDHYPVITYLKKHKKHA